MNSKKYDDKNFINVFKVNHKFEIYIPNPANDSIFDIYPSRIENISADNMTIALPMDKSFAVTLCKGDVFHGRMAFPNEAYAYEFSCSYLGKRMGSIPIWQVSLPYNISRDQQRQDVRYDISVSVTVKIIDSNDKEEIDRVEFLKTKDISGGGIKIISKKPYLLDTIVDVALDIPGYGEVTALAKVIRVQSLEESFSIYWNVLKFLEIIRTERDAIIQYIFKKQLEERRKLGKIE